MNSEDVGMIERGHGARFLFKRAASVGGEKSREEFSARRPSEARVFAR